VRHLVFFIACIVVGCDYPRDAADTLRKVQHSVIRAGVVENQPWVNLDQGDPSGIEPRLLQTLAESLGAKIEWTTGSETMLVERLEHRQLDIVIAGLTKDTPWSDRVGISQWYVRAIDPVTEKNRKHVWAVMPGESRWLLEVDKFLQTHRDDARELLAQAQQVLPDEASR
jgi:polar amino acid transport system substrate-binding protein